MVYDPDRHHRRSIRLRGYDYASAGMYFVTICTQDRACLFGEVVDGEMVPNIAGLMVESWWWSLTWRFPGVGVDANVVMPNHFHGIVMIGTGGQNEPGMTSDAGRHGGLPLRAVGHRHDRVGADLRVCPASANIPHDAPPSLGKIIQWFKSITTKDYAVGVNDDGWPPFRNRLWQRNYYERVVRNDHELDRTRAYIEGNPSRWHEDPENPRVIAYEG